MTIRQQETTKFRVWINESQSKAFDVEATSPEMAVALIEAGKAGAPTETLVHLCEPEGVWRSDDIDGPPLKTPASLDPEQLARAFEALPEGHA